MCLLPHAGETFTLCGRTLFAQTGYIISLFTHAVQTARMADKHQQPEFPSWYCSTFTNCIIKFSHLSVSFSLGVVKLWVTEWDKVGRTLAVSVSCVAGLIIIKC